MKWQLCILVIVIALLNCQEDKEKEILEGTNQGEKTIEYGVPQDVGMSRSRLEDAVDIYKRAAEEDRVTGVQLLVARHGKVVVHEAFGHRDLENRFLMEKNTLVRMASNTKTVVATGVLILAEDGRIDLEDPVSRYLPGFDQGLSGEIRIKHLLTHTPGYEYTYYNFVGEVTLTSPEFPDAPSLRVEASKIGREGPKTAPGKFFQYNNFGYTVLGALIEECSRQKLDAFLKQRIYTPLGMSDTSHRLYGTDSERLSVSYRKVKDKWEVIPPENPPFVRSTGGLVTTAWDFSKFCQMFLNGGSYGSKRVLSREMVMNATSPLVQARYQYVPPDLMQSQGMVTDWISERDNRKLGIDTAYGYGWVISKDGSYNHSGYRGTFAHINPSLDLIILIFGQSREGGDPGQEFIEAVEAAVVE